MLGSVDRAGLALPAIKSPADTNGETIYNSCMFSNNKQCPGKIPERESEQASPCIPVGVLAGGCRGGKYCGGCGYCCSCCRNGKKKNTGHLRALTSLFLMTV